MKLIRNAHLFLCRNENQTSTIKSKLILERRVFAQSFDSIFEILRQSCSDQVSTIRGLTFYVFESSLTVTRFLPTVFRIEELIEREARSAKMVNSDVLFGKKSQRTRWRFSKNMQIENIYTLPEYRSFSWLVNPINTILRQFGITQRLVYLFVDEQNSEQLFQQLITRRLKNIVSNILC